MRTVLEQIDKYKSLSEDIECSINENNIDKAKTLLNEYNEIQNSQTYDFKAIIYFKEGNYKDAISVLENGMKEHPFHFSLHFNLAFIYGVLQKFEESFINYFYAIKYSLSKEEKESAIKGFEEVSKLAIEESVYTPSILQNKIKELKQILNQHDARVYPIDANGISIIRKPQQVNTPNEHMVNMYKTLNYQNVDLQSRMLFKSELINGKVLCGERKWNTTEPVVIPISRINDIVPIHITVNDTKHTFTKDHLPINQFHYIRISEPGEIKVTADKEVFVGEPIKLTPKEKPIKLVLKLFIDGLSYQFLEDVGLEKAMPHTYSFFKEGLIATNCNTTSEWTLPSKASINTGLYANYHNMLHPEYLSTFSNSDKMLAEYYQQAGYYCTNISGNWRTTPPLGYNRGYDRMIYQNFLGGFGANEIIMEAIEHITTFSETNNFLTMTIMDLHNVPDEIENHLYSQVHTDVKDKVNKNKRGITSVQTQFDKSKIEKYFSEIKRIDNQLAVLFDFILKSFNPDEFVVALHSDHGQSFLSDSFDLLGNYRTRVPFMLRGKDVLPICSEELMETVDIVPAMLHLSELEYPSGINGQVPQILGGKTDRKFTFSQSIHPNQTYKVRIKEKKLSYYLETQNNVHSDLTINLKNFTSKVVDDQTGEQLKDNCLQRKQQYEQFVFNHIKHMLRWDE